MRGKIYKKLLLLCAFLHLSLVTLSAFYIDIAAHLPATSLIDFYGKASGADSNYGFFAPAIGGKVRAVFNVIESNGKKLTNLALVPPSEREAEIRAGGIFDELITKDSKDKSLRKTLAKSLAATMFYRHKNATLVSLHIEEYWPKTMAEYREGERAQWSDYYVADFVRNEGEE